MKPYSPSSSLSSQASFQMASNPFLSFPHNNNTNLDHQIPLPRPPGTEASIWAPSALRMQKTLPKSSHPPVNYVQDEFCMYGAFGAAPPSARPVTREDVFGPAIQPTNLAHSAGFSPFSEHPTLKPSVSPEDQVSEWHVIYSACIYSPFGGASSM
jgi:hypothetical protein